MLIADRKQTFSRCARPRGQIASHISPSHHIWSQAMRDRPQTWISSRIVLTDDPIFFGIVIIERRLTQSHWSYY